MKRADFESEVREFIGTVEYVDGIKYEIEPEEGGEPPRATIIVEMNGEEDYRIPIGVSEVFYGRESADQVGINTWEDNYIELDREGFYAWLWGATLKRLRAAKEGGA